MNKAKLALTRLACLFLPLIAVETPASAQAATWTLTWLSGGYLNTQNKERFYSESGAIPNLGSQTSCNTVASNMATAYAGNIAAAYARAQYYQGYTAVNVHYCSVQASAGITPDVMIVDLDGVGYASFEIPMAANSCQGQVQAFVTAFQPWTGIAMTGGDTGVVNCAPIP